MSCQASWLSSHQGYTILVPLFHAHPKRQRLLQRVLLEHNCTRHELGHVRSVYCFGMRFAGAWFVLCILSTFQGSHLLSLFFPADFCRILGLEWSCWGGCCCLWLRGRWAWPSLGQRWGCCLSWCPGWCVFLHHTAMSHTDWPLVFRLCQASSYNIFNHQGTHEQHTLDQ